MLTSFCQGISEESVKKRTRKTKKFMRPVVGASLEIIRAKRNQKPEVREAQRKAAVLYDTLVAM